MSLERQKATKGLAIHIDDPQKSYTTGDIIAGRVFRQVPVIVGADGVKITIRLVGRSTIKRTIWSDHLGEASEPTQRVPTFWIRTSRFSHSTTVLFISLEQTPVLRMTTSIVEATMTMSAGHGLSPL